MKWSKMSDEQKERYRAYRREYDKRPEVAEKKRERKRRWVAANRERRRATDRAWYARKRKNDPEWKAKRSAWYKAWYEANGDKVLAYKRKYYESDEHKADRYARCVEWRKKNPERTRELQRRWTKKNPDYKKRQWRRMVDDEERHERELLKRHLRDYPNAPYRPNYKARRVASWRLGRPCAGWLIENRTMSQMAFAKELYRERRERMSA